MMTMNNPELYETMRIYVFKGMEIVRKRNAGLPNKGEATRFYQPFPEAAYDIIELVRPLEDELHALPEYAALISALEADEVIAPQIGQMVGTPYTLTRVSLQGLTDYVIADCLEKPSDVSDEQAFDERYEELEHRLYTTEIPLEELDLLGEFTSEILPIRLLGEFRTDDMPIRLLDDVQIVEVTPGHLRSAITLGLLPERWMPGFAAPSCAIRHTWTFPRRVIDEPSGWTIERLLLAASLRRHITELTIAALRLFQDGWVVPVGTLAQGFEPPPGGTSRSEMYPPRWRFLPGEPYHLTAAQVPEFVQFWRWFLQATEPVHVAARRFSEARYRNRQEDQLLDLVIAAEALFGGGDSQEVGYKVRLRAAALLGNDAVSRRRIFGEFKTAYDLRSVIAHGSKQTKRQRQQIQRLPQLIVTIEQHIRDAVRKGISMSKWPSTHQEWDDALLGALGSHLPFS
jgi:hypothetical protein